MNEKNSKTVIVFEDNDALRSALVDLLNVRGFFTQGFYGIENYLSDAVNHQADIIISDVYLVDGTAFDIIEIISKNDARVPIILMSGSANPELAQRALANGAYAFLHKPFSVDKLISIIDSCVHN